MANDWPAAGVDVGGTKMLAVSLDRAGVIGAGEQQASPLGGSDLAKRVLEASQRLCPGGPAAIGVGIPGLVDAAGVVRYSPHLPGLVGDEIASGLRRELPDASIWLGNDATAACWAEHQLGAAAGSRDVLLITVGTGIGGGVVSGGRLLAGSNRYAGEFGHMVVDPHGPRCPCGKQGCWERYASGSGLGALAREAALAGEAVALVELAGGDPEAVRGEHVSAAAAAGDRAAIAIVERFAWWLALGLANLTNAFDPEVIVVGGGIVEAAPVLMGPLRRAFDELVEAPAARRGLRIEPAALGARAGAVGAALLAAGAGSSATG